MDFPIDQQKIWDEGLRNFLLLSGVIASCYCCLLVLVMTWVLLSNVFPTIFLRPNLPNQVRDTQVSCMLASNGHPLRPEQEECSICYDILADTENTLTHNTCSHSFHRSCLKLWIARLHPRLPRCPLCNTTFDTILPAPLRPPQQSEIKRQRAFQVKGRTVPMQSHTRPRHREEDFHVDPQAMPNHGHNLRPRAHVFNRRQFAGLDRHQQAI